MRRRPSPMLEHGIWYPTTSMRVARVASSPRCSCCARNQVERLLTLSRFSRPFLWKPQRCPPLLRGKLSTEPCRPQSTRHRRPLQTAIEAKANTSIPRTHRPSAPPRHQSKTTMEMLQTTFKKTVACRTVKSPAQATRLMMVISTCRMVSYLTTMTTPTGTVPALPTLLGHRNARTH